MFYNLFDLALRNLGSFFTSFIVTMILVPMVIKFCNKIKFSQPIRELGPESHQVKQGTPTMGGVAIVKSIIISSLLWCNLHNIYVWAVVFIIALFSTLGFVDDYKKVTAKNHYGIPPRGKFLIQIIGSLIVAYVIECSSAHAYNLQFIKNISLNLGWFYLIFVSFVIVGSSNATNLTDGLDGLLSFPVAVSSIAFSIVAYIVATSHLAGSMHVYHVEGANEIIPILFAIAGSSLAFLWYNFHPAQIFMGDVGSLALGGALGAISVILKQEFLLAIIGFIFVAETLSVIIQVYYFKMTKGKRFFLMAPIHHHFEKKGLKETKVAIRFWLVSIISALLGLFVFFG